MNNYDHLRQTVETIADYTRLTFGEFLIKHPALGQQLAAADTDRHGALLSHFVAKALEGQG